MIKFFETQSCAQSSDAVVYRDKIFGSEDDPFCDVDPTDPTTSSRFAIGEDKIVEFSV